MRITIPLAVAVLATALAGCSDDPASGTFAFESSSASIEGQIENAEFQDFVPVYDDTSGQQLDECPTQDLPPEVEVDRCTWAKTVIDANFSDLVDPQSGTYTVFFVDSDGQNPEEQAGQLEGVHQMGGAWMGEFHFDNSEDCEGQQGDQASQDCNKQNKFDTLEIRLGDVPYASAELASGAAFVVLEIHEAVRFEGSYSGKDFTVNVSGLNGNLTYTAWLITEEEGATVHAESFSVTSGENTYTAEMEGDEYVAFHIHVTGTKINVAVGNL